MTGVWYFHTTKDGIELLARFEGPGGMIGDARELVRPGESFLGLTHAALKAAKAGTVKVINGRAQVRAHRQRGRSGDAT
jgi:hypothetical protein